jgi:hypothetical protein
MATLTPKLGLKKPVPNTETDWGFRLNETIDILDGVALTTNIGGTDGIEIFDSGGGPVTVSGNRSEMLLISGSLQGQIDSIDTTIVSSLNSQTGDLTVVGAGEVSVSTAGTTITVSGTPHTGVGGGGTGSALVGVDGITTISGEPSPSEVTISGFRGEFVSASGALSTEIDNDIAVHASNSSAHHTRYSQEENDAIIGSNGNTVVSGSNTIDIQGFRPEFISASGSLQTQIDSIDVDEADVSSLNSLQGNLTIAAGENVIVSDNGSDTITVASIQDVSNSLVGSDGITVISGSNQDTIQGFETAFINASGSLQTQINGIDSSVTLQDAYDNGDGTITTAGGKPFEITGVGDAVIPRVVGGQGAGNNLILKSTTNATAGTIFLNDFTKFYSAGSVQFSNPHIELDLSADINNVNLATATMDILRLNPNIFYNVTFAKGFTFLSPMSFKPVLTSSGLGAGTDAVNYAAAFFQPTFDGSVGPRTANQMFGLFLQARVLGGSVTALEALRAGVNVSTAGTITTAAGINVATASLAGGGTITTNVGVDIKAQTAGSTNISLRSEGATATMRHLGSVSIGKTTAPTVTLDVAGTSAFSDTMTNNGPLVESASTLSLSANANNQTPDTAPVQIITANTTTRTITGFSSGSAGRVHKVLVEGSFGVILAHQNTSSTAANRIISPNGANLLLIPGQAATLYYRASTTNRWYVTDTTASGTIGL